MKQSSRSDKNPRSLTGLVRRAMGRSWGTLHPLRSGAPGIEHRELTDTPRPDDGHPVHPVRVSCIDFSRDKVLQEAVTEIEGFVSRHRPAWSKVRWINVEGLAHLSVIRALAEKYRLHPLAVEDILQSQRPKAEDYPEQDHQPGRLFVVAHMIEFEAEGLETDQLSCFLGRNTLLTFQHTLGDAFDLVRQRICTEGSRVRENDASFLLYSLLDAVVDNYYPVLEHLAERLEDVETQLLQRPQDVSLSTIHGIKRDLVLLRRAVWPMRDLISQLQRDNHLCLSQMTQTYFRDVYDHCVQIMDLVETYREVAGTLTETYHSAVSNRTNEIMKVLSIMGSIFIPLTFLAGVYGMNMPIPETQWWGTYPLFWLLCGVISGGMLLWFRRHGWL